MKRFRVTITMINNTQVTIDGHENESLDALRIGLDADLDRPFVAFRGHHGLTIVARDHIATIEIRELGDA